MDSDKVTLKDISNVIGVNMSTVHRALNDKDGVSEKMREEIKKTARKMGYKTNYIASSLKRKTIRFAVVLPKHSGNNKYFYKHLWSGAQRLIEEMKEFNIESIEFSYNYTSEGHWKTLKDIYENYNDIDGILTIGENNDKVKYYMRKFQKIKIPVVLIVSDLEDVGKLCCVKNYDKVAGSMAAELLTTFVNNPKGKLVVVGSMSILEQSYNFSGFKDYIDKNSSYTEIIKVDEFKNLNMVYNRVKDLLCYDKSIYGMYSCNARNTIPMCKAAIDLNLQYQLKIIGNDIFEESEQLLYSGVLDAIIHKRANEQAYIAMKVLFDYVVKGEYPEKDLVLISSVIVLKSNIDLYKCT